MSILRFVPALVPALLLGLAACNPPAPRVPGSLPAGGTPIATVDGHPVTQQMLDATLGRIPEEERQKLEQEGKIDQVKESLLLGEVLYRQALSEKLHEKPEMQVTLALAERSALAEALIEKVIDERLTDARIQKWYDDHAVQFKQPQAKLRIIVAPSEAAAAEIKTALDGGADFATVAREKSEDPKSKAEGGDIGWVSQRDLPPDFSTPVFAAGKGSVVGPIAAGPRALIFKVEELRDAVPLDEVKDQIKGSLKNELAQEFIGEMREKAKAAAAAGAGGATVTAPEPGAAPAAAPAGAPAAAPAAAPAGAPAGDHQGHGH